MMTQTNKLSPSSYTLMKSISEVFGSILDYRNLYDGKSPKIQLLSSSGVWV